MNKSLTIAIDFDGIIVEDNYPEIGQMRKGADLFINKLFQDGHVLIIHSNREGVHKEQAMKYLIRQGIPFHYFNENDQRLIDRYDNDSRKIGADIYIDDKSLFYANQTWHEIYLAIQSRIRK